MLKAVDQSEPDPQQWIKSRYNIQGFPSILLHDRDTKPEPIYPEADEKLFLEVVLRIFDVNSFPRPPTENKGKYRPVQKAYDSMQKAYVRMQHSMAMIKEFHSSFEPAEIAPSDIPRYLIDYARRLRSFLSVETPHGKEALPSLRHNFAQRIKICLAKIAKDIGLPIEDDKDMRRINFIEEREYWEKAMSYLYLRREIDRTNPEHEDTLFDEAECVQRFHIAQSIMKSAAHHEGAERDDGDLTIQHSSRLAMNEFNFYMAAISQSQNPSDKKKLMVLLKRAMLRGPLHDYNEDYAKPRGSLDPDFLNNKMTEYSNFDTGTERKSQKGRPNGEYSQMSFWVEERPIVMPELQALVEPMKVQGPLTEEESQSPRSFEPYIKTQIIDGLPPDSAIATFFTKIADRLDNIHTLKGQELTRQNKKILDTVELVELGILLLTDSRFKNHVLLPYLPERLIILCDAALEEINRIENISDYFNAAISDIKSELAGAKSNFERLKVQLEQTKRGPNVGTSLKI